MLGVLEMAPVRCSVVTGTTGRFTVCLDVYSYAAFAQIVLVGEAKLASTE